MHLTFKELSHGAIGLLFAASLNATELPAPLAAALNRLHTADAYSWKVDTQTPGAPFIPAPLRGWAKVSGEGWLEATVGRESIQAAILGARRVVKGEAGWKAPSEIAFEKNAQSIEVARLLRIPLPADELSALLKNATTIRAEADGSFFATLSGAAATEIIRSPTKDLPKSGFTPEINDAVASLQLWLKDSALEHYTISSTARLSLPFGTREIKQTTSVELREGSAAEVALPSAARSKLQAFTNP